jgi:protein-disulfide isomerase
VAVCAIVLSTACSSAAQPARPRTQGADEVVATVGRTSIRLGDVDRRALQQPASNFGSLTLAQALYEARRAALDEIIATNLLDEAARARGSDRSTLEQEIEAKVVLPTEVDIAAWFQANQSRVQGASLDQVRAPIQQLLLQERAMAAREEYLDALRARTRVTVTLEPPRVEVAAAGRPARGDERAPIELIEFSDFECPFCLRAFETVRKVLDAYGDRIRFVYRHYPLPNHPNARPAAEASACAADQDKFWPYHDRLFANPSRMGAADLKRYAAELGLDTEAFNACFDQRRHQALVDEDVAAGNAVGVSGTPAFFINGRPLTGAQPYEAFARIIDEELKRR